MFKAAASATDALRVSVQPMTASSYEQTPAGAFNSGIEGIGYFLQSTTYDLDLAVRQKVPVLFPVENSDKPIRRRDGKFVIRKLVF